MAQNNAGLFKKGTLEPKQVLIYKLHMPFSMQVLISKLNEETACKLIAYVKSTPTEVVLEDIAECRKKETKD